MNTRFLVGNCNEVMSQIETETVDLIVTSPPYDNIRDYKGFELDLHKLGNDCFRVLKDGGICAIVIQDGTKNFAKSLTSFRLAVDWVDNAGFKMFETIIYHKNGRPGAWWSKRFRVDHEFIFLFLKGERPKTFNKELLYIESKNVGAVFYGTTRMSDGSLKKIEPKKQAKMKDRGTVWFYKTSNTEKKTAKHVHPATFPDALADDLVSCFSNSGDVVLDPMCGSGTTCVCASKLGRNSIGIDISEEYINIAKSLILP